MIEVSGMVLFEQCLCLGAVYRKCAHKQQVPHTFCSAKPYDVNAKPRGSGPCEACQQEHCSRLGQRLLLGPFLHSSTVLLPVVLSLGCLSTSSISCFTPLTTFAWLTQR